MAKVLASAIEFELEVKKSRFITRLYPIDSKEQASDFVERNKQEFPDARHVCVAWRVGENGYANDDGEPSGTAGKPMLNVLEKQNITQTLAVVIRYFGGIKLGAGGLVRAYSQAVSQTLDKAELITQVAQTQLVLCIEFSAEARVRQYCTTHQIEILAQAYAEQATLTIQLPSSRQQAVQQDINELCHGQVTIKPND